MEVHLVFITQIDNMYDMQSFKMVAPMGTTVDAYFYELGIAAYAKHMYPELTLIDGIAAVYDRLVVRVNNNQDMQIIVEPTKSSSNCCGGGEVK